MSQRRNRHSNAPCTLVPLFLSRTSDLEPRILQCRAESRKNNPSAWTAAVEEKVRRILATSHDLHDVDMGVDAAAV